MERVTAGRSGGRPCWADGAGARRLGGAALAQAYGQMGDVAPDMDDPAYFRAAWEATQALVAERLISAGHDVSDGGFVTAALEMAFPHPTAGIDVTLPTGADGDETSALFAEELAIFLEVTPENRDRVLAACVPVLLLLSLLPWRRKLRAWRRRYYSQIAVLASFVPVFP